MKKGRKKCPSVKGRSVKKRVVVCCGAVAVALLLGIFGYGEYRQSRPLLVVGGYEVSREEYRWAMYQARDDVLSEHSAHGITSIEWDVSTRLGMPYEMVAQRAVEILCEYYAVSTLAVERGYLEDAGYEALTRELEEENRLRSEAVASGGIVTGLSSYDLEQYIEYRTSALRRQFCDDESNPEMTVTQQEVRQRYEADKATLYTVEDTRKLRFIEIRDVPEEQAEALEAQVLQLRERTAQCGSMAEAVNEMPQLQEYYQELTIDSDSYAAYARSYGDLLVYAQELDTGDVSQVICCNGWIWLIECVERIENDYASYESVAAVVERSIREQRYDALVAQRAAQMEIGYDAAELYRYTARQLG